MAMLWSFTCHSHRRTYIYFLHHFVHLCRVTQDRRKWIPEHLKENLTERSAVCSLHFVDTDYEKKNVRIFLKSKAKPKVGNKINHKCCVHRLSFLVYSLTIIFDTKIRYHWQLQKKKKYMNTSVLLVFLFSGSCYRYTHAYIKPNQNPSSFIRSYAGILYRVVCSPFMGIQLYS